MVTVLEEQTVDYEATARIATEAFAAENIHFFDAHTHNAIWE